MEEKSKRTEESKLNSQTEYMLKIVTKNKVQEEKIIELQELVKNQEETIDVLEKIIRSNKKEKERLAQLIKQIRERISRIPFIGRHLLKDFDSVPLERRKETNAHEFRRKVKAEVEPKTENTIKQKQIENEKNR